MNDVDELLRSDAERWRARQAPVFDLDEAVAAARSRARPARRYLLPVLAAAVVLAVAVGLVITLHRLRRDAPADSGLSAITGVTWRDPDSTGTVVYTDTTMRIFDGCMHELAQLRVVGETLVQGPPVGGTSVCAGGLEIGPGPAGAASRAALRRLAHFHAVVAGPATWSRAGNVLVLTTPGKGTLRLTTDTTPAPQLVGTTWHLVDYAGADDNEHAYTGVLTLRVASDGSFRADVTCGQLTGTATVTPTTVDFTSVHGCGSFAPADDVIRAVLGGHAGYAVRGEQLILNGSGQLLVYQVGSS